MSDRMGGTASRMDALKIQFDREGAEVERLISTLDGWVGTVIGPDWFGAKAEEFRGNWQQQFKPALTKLREALADNSRYIDQKRAGLQQWDT